MEEFCLKVLMERQLKNARGEMKFTSEPGFQEVEAIQRAEEAGCGHFPKGKWKHSRQGEQWSLGQEKETQN